MLCSNIVNNICGDIFYGLKSVPIIGHAIVILQAWDIRGFSYSKDYFYKHEIDLSAQAKEKFDALKNLMGVDKEIVLFDGNSTGASYC